MLKALTIQNLAVVRHLDVEFESGLTILTGETGAGKSILIEALGLALGDRADTSMIRSDADRASVSASFDIAGNDPARTLLRDNDLEDENECILRRVLGADGRSRAFCNAAPIPVQLLKQIGEVLVDIHGQHAHQSLLRKPVQRELLDNYAQDNALLTAVAETYQGWRDLVNEREALSHGVEDVPSRIDLLEFQVRELQELNINAESLSSLESEHRLIAHATRLAESCEETSASVFSGDNAALPAIVKAVSGLTDITDLDPGIDAAVELMNQAAINLEEAERELAQVNSRIESDPRRLADIESQLQSIHDAARKHRCEAAELPQRLVDISSELEGLNHREQRIGVLNEEIDRALDTYHESAKKLHAARGRAASRMNKDITTRIRELGIIHGEFAVQVELREGQPTPYGLDEIEFLVTANPDLPIRSIKKVVSGGELSRISLAIQASNSGASGVPVLVFDEVDTGVGGPTAEVVSRYLRELANSRQILCITHLPQVASAGEQHFSIGKIVTRGITETTILDLDSEQRVEEIARMLGGQKITRKALEHARELLAD